MPCSACSPWAGGRQRPGPARAPSPAAGARRPPPRGNPPPAGPSRSRRNWLRPGPSDTPGGSRRGLMFWFVAAVVLVVAVPMSLRPPRRSRGAWYRLRRAADRLARRRAWAVVLVGGTAFGLAAGLSLWAGPPAPAVHDEFSYL